MARLAGHGTAIVALTLLTQVGGLAWLIALAFRWRLPAFLMAYAALFLVAVVVAPLVAREPLPCVGEASPRMHSLLYCALNRHYVVPELATALGDLADAIEEAHPGTQLVLDAGFPFLDGFPLLPRLSHDSGRQADLAFFYQDGGKYLPGETRSPLGYFAFEEGPTDCPSAWPTLRWDLEALQPFWRELALDEARLVTMVRLLAADERVRRIFLEPHLVQRPRRRRKQGPLPRQSRIAT